MSHNTWIISTGTYTDIDFAAIGINAKPSRAMEYKLSDIGHYLIYPGPIEVKNRLVGCECHLKPRFWKGLWTNAAHAVRGKSLESETVDPGQRELFLARPFLRIPSLKDRELVKHVDQMRDKLHPFEPVAREIAAINLNRLKDIRGICEDEGGNRTFINLNGDLQTKQRYILDHLLNCVPITLQHARIADGLYEMRGLSASGYREDRHYRLLRFQSDGRFFACLLNQAGKVAFWIDDLDHLHHLFVLQQAITSNPILKSSLEACLHGNARALRLMLNRQMDIDYSRNRLPPIYRDLFRSFGLDIAKQKMVIRSLNTYQMGISFSYVASEGHGDPRPITDISVMHDVKALDPVRQEAPNLYAEISRQATLSEAGNYYLLESIKGYPDEAGL